MKILNKKSFWWVFRELQWRSLVRPPCWYTEETPNIDLIKMKDRYVVKQFKDSEILAGTFIETFLSYAKELCVYNQFLNNAVEESFI